MIEVRRLIGLGFVFALAAGSAADARAEIGRPTCDALVTWLQGVKLGDREPVTPFGRLAI